MLWPQACPQKCAQGSRDGEGLRPTCHASAIALLPTSPQASQVNDAKKYVVTEVRVRVLAVNSHPPHFGKLQYQAFVHEDESMAALVVTYSGRVLSLNAADMDFAGVSHLWGHYCRKAGDAPISVSSGLVDGGGVPL